LDAVANTVLLVEDEDDTREMLAAAMERVGYRCISARNGEEALDRATAAGPIDVVVTDVVMGGDDRRGLRLMAELRTLGVTAPIIVITAFADVDKVKTALNHGAAHFIEKPFRATELIDAVERVRAPGRDLRHVIDEALVRANLTEKEMAVARHLLEGRTNDEIAQIEQNSPKTIKQHVTQIYLKSGARNRVEFVRMVCAPVEKRSESKG
jgi:DNA-binding NarL/FixJ family response regulator